MSMEALSSVSSNNLPDLWQIQQYLVSLVANHTSKEPEFDKMLLHIYLIGVKNGLAKILAKTDRLRYALINSFMPGCVSTVAMKMKYVRLGTYLS